MERSERSERSERPERSAERRERDGFHGRRKAQALKPAHKRAMEHLASLRVGDVPNDLSTLFEVPVSRVRLEIGFGGGEHLMHRARTEPGTGFIGVEPFVNGMAKLLRAWEAEPLRNIRLHDEDAGALLDRLPEASLDHVDLLYPDPWRKLRHHKRRFVGPQNLDRLACAIRPGGTFHFASDWADYVNWTLAHLQAHPAFAWEAASPADWRESFEGWPGTRYEAKALREGRTPAYLRFRRV